MERVLIDDNLQRWRQLLESESDERRREMLLRLIAEFEEKKDRMAGSPADA